MQMGCCFDDTVKGKNIRFCFSKAGKFSPQIKYLFFTLCVLHLHPRANSIWMTLHVGK